MARRFWLNHIEQVFDAEEIGVITYLLAERWGNDTIAEDPQSSSGAQGPESHSNFGPCTIKQLRTALCQALTGHSLLAAI